MKTMKSYLGKFAAVSLLMASGAVIAAPIQGDVTFTGNWEPKMADGVTNATIGTATHIHFLPGVEVSQSLGDFAGANGNPVSYTSFTFNPFAGPIAPLWSFDVNGTTFSFNLEAITLSFQGPNNLVLNGSGTAFAGGFDATPFLWSFSGDSFGAILSFSAAATDVAVPEPSVVGLLGLGLITMGAMGVRRRNAARKA